MLLKLILPFSLLLATGLILLYFPPKSINSWYGYRTANSMESEYKWKKAQKTGVLNLIKSTLVIGVINLLLLVFYPEFQQPIIVIIEMLFVMLYTFLATENKLNKIDK